MTTSVCDTCRIPIILIDGRWYHLIDYVDGHHARQNRS